MNLKYSLGYHVVRVLLVVAVAGCAEMPSLISRVPSPISHVPRPVSHVKSPEGERLQAELMPETTDRLGEYAYQVKLKTVDICQDPKAITLVERVANRIIEAAKRTEYAEAVNQFKWEVTLIDDDNTIDAFALPGGKIGVYTGLLIWVTRYDDGKLAVVLGHEVVHALARHAAERLSKELRGHLAITATCTRLRNEGLSTEATAGVMAAMGISYEAGVILPFSRKHESEADHIGLLLMARAAYDPRKAIYFWKRMEEKFGGDQLPELLSTHPSYETRIKQLEEWMPEALKCYREEMGARRGRSKRKK